MIFLKTWALTCSIRTYFYYVAGTQIQTRAWKHANAWVVEHIALMVTMSDYQQQFHELRFKDRLSVADAVVLEHRLGLTKAANFFAEVGPWCYPHDDSPAFIGVKTYLQSVVAQATHAARSLSQFSDTSITDFLLSPLLVKKGDRPNLVRKPKAQRTPKPRADVTAAATVARKPTSQPVDLPIIEGKDLQTFASPLTTPSLFLH